MNHRQHWQQFKSEHEGDTVSLVLAIAAALIFAIAILHTMH